MTLDRGSYATLGGPYPFYGYNSRVYIYPDFLTRLDGSWSNPEVDDRIDDETGAECMAVVLSEQDVGQGNLALLGAEAAFRLRAERTGFGSGRTYAKDGAESYSVTGTLAFEDVELPRQGESFLREVVHRAADFSSYGKVSASQARVP